MKKIKEPSPIVLDYIKRRLDYDSLTGIVSRDGKAYKANRVKGRTIYTVINLVLDTLYEGCSLHCQVYAHHVAWYLTHGVWPNQFIDHIDGNGSNNQITNLRLATHQQNNTNSRPPLIGSSQYKGVFRRGNKFRAYITANGIRYDLGTHSSEMGAAQAYNSKAIELFGTFAYLNIIPPAMPH